MALPREPSSSERRIAARQRETLVIEYAKGGMSFRQIAEKLNFAGPGPAYGAFKRAMDRTVKLAADEYREIHRARLEQIWATHYPAMLIRDYKATDRCLRALSQLAALDGLNAPVKVDLRVVLQAAVAQFGLTEDEAAALQLDVATFIDTASKASSS